MSVIHRFAILYPAEGKSERMMEVMRNHGKTDYTLRFLITEPVELETDLETMSQEERLSDTGLKALVVFETYTSKESARQHESEPWFQTTTDKFMDEGLMAKPPYIISTVAKAGFDLDRKLVGE